MALWLLFCPGLQPATAQAQPAVTAMALAATQDGGGATLRLTFAQPLVDAPTPRAVTAHGDPLRLRIDFDRLSWPPGPPPTAAGVVSSVRYGLASPLRSRLLVTLRAPALPAVTQTKGGVLTIMLKPVGDASFAAAVAARREAPASPMHASPAGLRIALDPGHGGRDPGAVWRDDAGDAPPLLEKTVVMEHALALAEALRARGHAVALTRDDDRFMSLGARVARAQRLQADVLLSLHADAAPQPGLSGASVYTLSPLATDPRAAALAARENGADSAFATAFPDAEADVAAILTALARGAVARRTQTLGAAIAQAFTDAGLALPSRPLRAAGFAVLRAPEVPSALVELGFLSSAADRARLTNPAQRDRIATVIADAVDRWARRDPSAPADAGR